MDEDLDRAPGTQTRARRREAERTAGRASSPGASYGFFTDTTLCIGCKACEVACKEWNQLPAEDDGLTGMSYDNTGGLGAHDLAARRLRRAASARDRAMPPFQTAG
jgi:formate dehydrogenase iron-sulfur subunit